MKTGITSPLGLKAAGVGPKIFKWVTMLIIIAILTGILLPEVSAFPGDAIKILNPAGWFWLVAGIIFWLCGVIQFIIDFPKGKLITSGIYSVSRNPIYASWIVFVLPGLAVVCNNWIFLLAALVMYILLNINIKEEENDLTAIFGEKYIVYKNQVNRILTFPQFYNL